MMVLWDADVIAIEVWQLINQPKYVYYVWSEIYTVQLYELIFGMPKDPSKDFPLRTAPYDRVFYPGMDV